MAYYDPSYYPYYSARHAYNPNALHLQNRINLIQDELHMREKLDLENAIRREEQYICRNRLQQYEEDLRIKQMEHITRSHIEKDLIIEQQQSILNRNYLDKISNLKAERSLLLKQQLDKYTSDRKPEKPQEDDFSKKAEQYQQLLLDKINSSKTKGILKNKNSSYENDSTVKKSYVDQLNRSKNYDPSSSKLKRKQKQSQEDSPLKNIYSSKKKSKGKLRSQSISMISNKKNRNQSLSNGPFVEQLSNNALKKIQNRLLVSSIVYKDSKWRNIKHQTDHLINTYENEVKGRRQIKNKINNNPKILRKHALVVQSR